MKKTFLTFFLLLGCLCVYSQNEYFNFKSNIDLLRSQYGSYAYNMALVRKLTKTTGSDYAYKAIYDQGVINENLPSVFNSTNSQTKYYKKYGETVKTALNLFSALPKFPVYFLKNPNKKITLTVNFIYFGEVNQDVSDKELIDIFIDKGFKYFNKIRICCDLDEENNIKEVESIGISFLFAYIYEAQGVAIYIKRSDIRLYDIGSITKEQLILRCTVYRETDKFRLIQKGLVAQRHK